MAKKNISSRGGSKKKPFYYTWWFWGIIILILFAAVSGNSDDEEVVEEEVAVESHVYDNAEVIDVLNGSGTAVVSSYSLIEIDSSEATEEALEDWYFNYICETDYDWYVILYTDSDDNSGIYGCSTYIEVDVTFEENSSEVYMLSGSENGTIYMESDGALVAQ